MRDKKDNTTEKINFKAIGETVVLESAIINNVPTTVATISRASGDRHEGTYFKNQYVEGVFLCPVHQGHVVEKLFGKKLPMHVNYDRLFIEESKINFTLEQSSNDDGNYYGVAKIEKNPVIRYESGEYNKYGVLLKGIRIEAYNLNSNPNPKQKPQYKVEFEGEFANWGTKLLKGTVTVKDRKTNLKHTFKVNQGLVDEISVVKSLSLFDTLSRSKNYQLSPKVRQIVCHSMFERRALSQTEVLPTAPPKVISQNNNTTTKQQQNNNKTHNNNNNNKTTTTTTTTRTTTKQPQ